MEYDPSYVSDEITEAKRTLSEVLNQLEEVCTLRGITLNRDTMELEYPEEDVSEDIDAENTSSTNSEEIDRITDVIEDKVQELSKRVEALELYMYQAHNEQRIDKLVTDYLTNQL